MEDLATFTLHFLQVLLHIKSLTFFLKWQWSICLQAILNLEALNLSCQRLLILSQPGLQIAYKFSRMFYLKLIYWNAIPRYICTSGNFYISRSSSRVSVMLKFWWLGKWLLYCLDSYFWRIFFLELFSDWVVWPQWDMNMKLSMVFIK